MSYLCQHPLLGASATAENPRELVLIKEQILLATIEALVRIHWDHGDHAICNGVCHALSEYTETVQYALNTPLQPDEQKRTVRHE